MYWVRFALAVARSHPVGNCCTGEQREGPIRWKKALKQAASVDSFQ